MDAHIGKVKKGVNLVIGSYRFQKDRKYGEKQHWRCVDGVKGCKARMHTVGEGDDLTMIHQVDHNHIPDEEKTANIITKAELSRKAQDKPVLSLQQIYREHMADTLLTDDILSPGYHGCRSQMQRARRQHQAALPKDRHSVDLSGAWSLTNANQSFILYQDNYMLIFTTDENLKILAASDTMYIDGAFKSFPHLYQRIYSLHGSYRATLSPWSTLYWAPSLDNLTTPCSPRFVIAWQSWI